MFSVAIIFNRTKTLLYPWQLIDQNSRKDISIHIKTHFLKLDHLIQYCPSQGRLLGRRKRNVW